MMFLVSENRSREAGEKGAPMTRGKDNAKKPDRKQLLAGQEDFLRVAIE